MSMYEVDNLGVIDSTYSGKQRLSVLQNFNYSLTTKSKRSKKHKQ